MIALHSRRTRRFLASTAASVVLAGSGIGYAAHSRADYFNPRIPIPALTWCPGGGGGSAWGGYCEGTTFPDGTRLNYFRALGFWQGPRCVRPNGTPDPMPAPGGCGGIG